MSARAIIAVDVYCPGNCGEMMRIVEGYLTCPNQNCEYFNNYFERPMIELKWINPTDPRYNIPKAQQR